MAIETKTKVLAVQGGTKAVTTSKPHFVWPVITDKTRRAVMAQLDQEVSIYDNSGIIGTIERRLREYHSTSRCLVTSSGTAALHSLYVGAGLGPGDEVLVPAYTFFATVTPIFQTGAVPILVDAGPDGNISVDDIARKISPRTKAIMVTHMWGLPCDMPALLAIAKERGLLLFEDGSHAHGARFDGRVVGSFGDGAAFSMQGQKTLTGGEGGFVVTNQDEIYFRALLLGHYNKRCKSEIPKSHSLSAFYQTGIGLKLRAHPLALAIANEQLDELDTVVSQRDRMAERMARRLNALPGLSVVGWDDRHIRKSSWYAMILKYDTSALGGLPIQTFHEALLAEGCLEADRPGSTGPLNRLPLFQRPGALIPSYEGKMSYRDGDFPGAENFSDSIIKLPVWHDENDLALVDEYLHAFEKVVMNVHLLSR